MIPRLARASLQLLCRPGWPQTRREITCLCLLSVGVKPSCSAVFSVYRFCATVIAIHGNGCYVQEVLFLALCLLTHLQSSDCSASYSLVFPSLRGSARNALCRAEHSFYTYVYALTLVPLSALAEFSLWAMVNRLVTGQAKRVLFKKCVWILCLHVHLRTMCVPRAGRDQKRASGALELESHMAVSCHQSAGN